MTYRYTNKTELPQIGTSLTIDGINYSVIKLTLDRHDNKWYIKLASTDRYAPTSYKTLSCTWAKHRSSEGAPSLSANKTITDMIESNETAMPQVIEAQAPKPETTNHGAEAINDRESTNESYFLTKEDFDYMSPEEWDNYLHEWAFDLACDLSPRADEFKESFEKHFHNQDYWMARKDLYTLKDMYESYYETVSNFDGCVITEEDGFWFPISYDELETMECDLQSAVERRWAEMIKAGDDEAMDAAFGECEVENIREMYFEGIYCRI